jgi:hypothetical protein
MGLPPKLPLRRTLSVQNKRFEYRLRKDALLLKVKRSSVKK